MSRKNSEVVSLWKETVLSKVYQNTERSVLRSDQHSDQKEKHFTKYFSNTDIDSFIFSEELTVDSCGNVSGIQLYFLLMLTLYIQWTRRGNGNKD